MSVSKIMSKCVVECTEDAPLEQVYEGIRKCEHGLVVVIESEAHRVPIGIVSERSICEQLITRGKNPRNLTAGAVLDARIRTVRESDSLDALAITGDEQISAVVVTNEQRQVCGIVPKERLRIIGSRVQTRSPGLIFVNMNARRSPAAREIPAFGWIQ